MRISGRLGVKRAAVMLITTALTLPAIASGQPAPAPSVPPPSVPTSSVKASTAPSVPVTMEYYYRIKWGSAAEFKRLYDRNHAPLLVAMQKAGFVRSVVVEEPFTHMAGGPRWDLRVTIGFPDATAALPNPEWDRLWEAERKRLYPDKAGFDAEENRRFSLLEDHWDIVVSAVAPER